MIRDYYDIRILYTVVNSISHLAINLIIHYYIIILHYHYITFCTCLLVLHAITVSSIYMFLLTATHTRAQHLYKHLGNIYFVCACACTRANDTKRTRNCVTYIHMLSLIHISLNRSSTKSTDLEFSVVQKGMQKPS